MQKTLRISIVYLFLALGFSAFGQSAITDSLKTGLQHAKTDSMRIVYLMALCDHTTYTNGEEALGYCRRARDLAIKNNFDLALARTWEREGSALFHMGKKDEARQSYLKAYEANQKPQNYEIFGSVYYNLGNIYYELSKFDSTLYYADKAAALFLSHGDSIGYAATRYLIIGMYADLGQYTKAMETGLEALRIFQRHHVQQWEMFTLNNLVDIYSLKGEKEKALEMINTVIANYERSDNQKFLAVAYRYKGDILNDLERYDEADTVLNRSYRIALDGNFVPEQAKTLLSLGNLRFNMKDYVQAEKDYRQALRINREQKDRYYTGTNLLGMGKSEYEQGKLREAKANLTEANTIMKEFDEDSYMKDITGYLAKVYEAENDFKNALSWYKLYAAYSDSVTSDEKSKELAEVTAKYESEKNRAVIQQLQTENELAGKNRRNLLLIAILVVTLTLAVVVMLFMRNRKNRQLVQKSAEVDRMKTRFFANISHEFRTPLSLILSPLYELNKEMELKKFKPLLSVIEHNARRLLSLINQILDLARLESGGVSTRVVRQDLAVFLNRITASFRSLAESRNIAFETDTPTDKTLFNYDPENLEVILNNLLSNAFKNEPDNGKVIFSAAVPGDAQKATFRVRNTGSYIPPERIAQIFNRFYTGTETDNGSHSSGTGIGLALTSELVNLAKGRITVESSEADGTTFILVLPLNEVTEYSPVEVPAQERQELVGPTTIPENSRTPEHAETALIIEDNHELRSFIKSCLTPSFKVIAAEDGIKGVATALEQIPDIIVSDVMMPGIDGMEVCSTLKNNEKTSHIPIILLTAKASQESKLEGLKAAADDYLLKPFQPDELVQRMQNLIAIRAQLREKFSKDLLYKPGENSVSSVDDRFFQKLTRIIEENISNEALSIEELSSAVSMSRSQLHRKLHNLTGLSASQYVRNYRLKRSREFLSNKAGTVSEIAYMVGFSSPAYFNKCFKAYFGITPGELAHPV
ncbi:tetratricopeptide repeat protein [Saccharicrinis sp. FJH62]|uniref:hybrid sensor histidine kinase/response regulator transcription factor n=1 Tax=Saccharicrinis sp. FJH62 TaxID=3344657 RepID=UPI0035D3FAAC